MSKEHSSFNIIKNFWAGKPMFDKKRQISVVNSDHRRTKTTISNDIKFESEILCDKILSTNR